MRVNFADNVNVLMQASGVSASTSTSRDWDDWMNRFNVNLFQEAARLRWPVMTSHRSPYYVLSPLPRVTGYPPSIVLAGASIDTVSQQQLAASIPRQPPHCRPHLRRQHPIRHQQLTPHTAHRTPHITHCTIHHTPHTPTPHCNSRMNAH
jgi:hypothetical protein